MGGGLKTLQNAGPICQLLAKTPTSEASNVGYTASPELWIEMALSHDRRHKNPDEPASPRARGSKAASIESARLSLQDRARSRSVHRVHIEMRRPRARGRLISIDRNHENPT